MDIEKRYSEMSTTDRLIEGYACVFNQESNDLGFIEIIHDGAITEQTIRESDVLCKFNHNDEKVLARSRYGDGTLQLEVDDIGLRYAFEAPRTALGDELLEYLKRGDLSQSSFAFTVAEDKFEYVDGITYRHIYKIERLWDVSPVFTPAYEKTTVECKRYLEYKESVSRLLEELNKQTEEINNL